MSHGKIGPKILITTPTFFTKLHPCGWYWGSCHEFLYMNYGVINKEAQSYLTYNLGTTYHTAYSIHTYHHIHGKGLFA